MKKVPNKIPLETKNLYYSFKEKSDNLPIELIKLLFDVRRKINPVVTVSNFW